MRDRFKFLRRPPKLPSNDDAGIVSKRPRLANDVEISEKEKEEYECNVKSLQKEMEKKKPKSSELCSLMEKTYLLRKKWIHEQQPPTTDILAKFPALKKPKVVSPFDFSNYHM